MFLDQAMTRLRVGRSPAAALTPGGQPVISDLAIEDCVLTLRMVFKASAWRQNTRLDALIAKLFGRWISTVPHFTTMCPQGHGLELAFPNYIPRMRHPGCAL